METGLLVLALPAIIGTVNLLKSLEIKGKALTLSSVFVGFLFVLGAQLLPDGIGRIIYFSVLGGLGASGFWDLAQLVGLKRSETTITTTQQVTPSVQVATAVKVDPDAPIVTGTAQPH